MPKIKTRIHSILWDYDTLYGEILSGLLTIGWGLLLLFPLPGETATTLYSFLVSILPIYMWGTIIATLGAIQLGSAITLEKSWRRSGAIFIFPFWLFLGLLIFATGFNVTGFIFYGLFALFCAYVNFRLILGKY